MDKCQFSYNGYCSSVEVPMQCEGKGEQTACPYWVVSNAIRDLMEAVQKIAAEGIGA